MVEAIEDMLEAKCDEPRGGLMPSWVEPDESRVAVILEYALLAIRRHEVEYADGAHAEMCEHGSIENRERSSAIGTWRTTSRRS